VKEGEAVGLMLTKSALLAPVATESKVAYEVAPAGQPGPQPNLLRQLIGRVDDVLRWWRGVHRYSRRAECLLRIALGQTAEVTWLTDGSRLPPGAEIIDLHLWNERLCLLPPFCRGLGRAAALRRRMAVSLAELARHIEVEASLCSVAAIRAQTALVPKGRIGKLLRVAAAFGFEPAAASRCKRRKGRQVGRFCEDLFISALAWAFNPEALGRSGWRRQPCELWISRAALLSAYGRGAARDRDAGRSLRTASGRIDFSRLDAPKTCANPVLALDGLSTVRDRSFV
jgi:hypothetical protein